MHTVEMATWSRWDIDPVRSIIGFKVKHLVVSTICGEFKEYTANICTKGEDFHGIEIDVRINPASVSTSDTARDAHLKGADCFDVESFKEINFKATSLEKTTGEIYVLDGDLTMKSITKQIRLDVEFDGVTQDPRGDKKAYFLVTGKINRKDWGLTWSTLMETGGVLVGEDIFIKCEIELVKQPGRII